MFYEKKKDKEVERVYRKVYVLINGEKVYIDPEIVKKYNLDKQEVSGFTYRKLYTEGD
ncbi:MAG: hypothetical protein V3U56_14735 [Syntrophobacteria bacterium]|jgi:hypothetical protein